MVAVEVASDLEVIDYVVVAVEVVLKDPLRPFGLLLAVHGRPHDDGSGAVGLHGFLKGADGDDVLQFAHPVSLVVHVRNGAKGRVQVDHIHLGMVGGKSAGQSGVLVRDGADAHGFQSLAAGGVDFVGHAVFQVCSNGQHTVPGGAVVDTGLRRYSRHVTQHIGHRDGSGVGLVLHAGAGAGGEERLLVVNADQFRILLLRSAVPAGDFVGNLHQTGLDVFLGLLYRLAALHGEFLHRHGLFQAGLVREDQVADGIRGGFFGFRVGSALHFIQGVVQVIGCGRILRAGVGGDSAQAFHPAFHFPGIDNAQSVQNLSGIAAPFLGAIAIRVEHLGDLFQGLPVFWGDGGRWCLRCCGGWGNLRNLVPGVHPGVSLIPLNVCFWSPEFQWGASDGRFIKERDVAAFRSNTPLSGGIVPRQHGSLAIFDDDSGAFFRIG